LLDLERDDTRLAAITLLIARSNADLAISWGRLSSFLPAHRQTFFLLSLI
jgi:hypothetical protein